MTEDFVSLTRTQIDRLGDRLRQADPTESDLRLLDQYRRSFGEAYEFVVEAIREQLNLNPTGRPAKSTTSVRDKLRRESIRLTQMQDIAGCRVVVEDIQAQDTAVQRFSAHFADVAVVDRRMQPSHGYRAVHVIVRHMEQPVEVQIRTKLQHRWAELSEKLSDYFDPSVKYGGGPSEIVTLLDKASDLVSWHEQQESARALSELLFPDDDPRQAMRLELEKILEETIQIFANSKRV